MPSPLPEKTCARCGRRFAWRKKWERDWEQVRYCSNACRRRKIHDDDHALEKRILRTLEDSKNGDLPLESLLAKGDASEPLRQAARRLAIAGRIQMIQSGREIDPRDLHGSVVVRLAR
ncbi:MAG: DUF2256 domain-containing protein [Planctomycetota bacterium]|nr:DUF2256 domain-containing protein [Planctomycetota bacterium]